MVLLKAIFIQMALNEAVCKMTGEQENQNNVPLMHTPDTFI